MGTSQETSATLRGHIETGIAKASRTKGYRLRDGTMVQRQSLSDLMDAKDRIASDEAVAANGGMFTKVAYDGDDC